MISDLGMLALLAVAGAAMLGFVGLCARLQR